MKTRLILIIKMKAIKISKTISNSKKINRIINLNVITTIQQRAIIINLIIFMIIQNCLKSQRTKSMTENLIILFAKS